jgi:alginate O-acetyltransferase complex protein AlgI
MGLYILILFFLIFINYFAGIIIERSNGLLKKRSFIFALLINISTLIILKYGTFIRSLSPSSYINNFDITKYLILPLGLSFFVFSSISYLIEIKRGRIKPERNMEILATFFMFFPKISQGPIERPQNMLYQFHNIPAYEDTRITQGIERIIIGLFKKMVIADRLAPYVNAIFDNVAQHNGTSIVLATFFFSIQIYADFSGYTDIALGSSKILGFNLMENFNKPYCAKSIGEFWSRWHISLSFWLRDYIYLPISYYFYRKIKKPLFNIIKIESMVYILSVLVTFLLCGLWHGQRINFIIWGLILGFYLIFSHFSNKYRKKYIRYLGISNKSIIYKRFRILNTYLLIVFAWLIFRENSFSQTSIIINKILYNQAIPFIHNIYYFGYSIIGFIMFIYIEKKSVFINNKEFIYFSGYAKYKKYLSYSTIIILILLIGVLDGKQFIYYKY